MNGLAHFPKCTAILTTHLMCSSQNHSPHMYMVPFARCNAFKSSFFCTVICLWNCLPHEAHSCSNLLEFKRYISPYFYAHNLVHSLISYCYIVYLTFIAENIFKKVERVVFYQQPRRATG